MELSNLYIIIGKGVMILVCIIITMIILMLGSILQQFLIAWLHEHPKIHNVVGWIIIIVLISLLLLLIIIYNKLLS